MHNATWHTITSEDSSLPANHVTGIAQADAGNLWLTVPAQQTKSVKNGLSI